MGHGTRRLLIDSRTFIRNVDRRSRYLQTDNGDARGRIHENFRRSKLLRVRPPDEFGYRGFALTRRW